MMPFSRMSPLAIFNFRNLFFLLLAFNLSSREVVIKIKWSIAQLVPIPRVGQQLQEAAWEYWEHSHVLPDDRDSSFYNPPIPLVNVQDHKEDLITFLEQTYGADWRRRPLLLKGLWEASVLKYGERKLSLEGLLQEKLTIPFFTDARIKGALTPDGHAPVGEIVANITKGKPHKIGSQLILETYPNLIEEVAPLHIVTKLFGNYFTPDRLEGTGPFHILPALTTVPLFIANGNNNNKLDDSETQPFTALHCEPIGNIAVQLSGRKRWTLVQPEYSFLIKPSTSPDGRAFFASWADRYDHVPTYSAITESGDAIWVPTWTWHRVDYLESEDIAIGASLFHFRFLDYITSNSLFAGLMIPALFWEMIGINTQ